MCEVDFGQLQRDDEYLFDLGSDVWLMDDHRWAFVVWTRLGYERGIGRFSLVHADHHRDGVNDFHENEEARDRLLVADLTEIAGLPNTRKSMTPFDVARLWRQQHGYIGRGGVVVLFNGEVQSWMNKLRNPEHWQPGCIAVDEEGHSWITIAGNDQRGALMWLANDEL